MESSGANHNFRIETVIHRGNCGKSKQPPCLVRKTCGGNHQRPCRVPARVINQKYYIELQRSKIEISAYIVMIFDHPFKVQAQTAPPCAQKGKGEERDELPDSPAKSPCSAKANQSHVSVTISQCGGRTGKSCGGAPPAVRPNSASRAPPRTIVRQRPQRPCQAQQNRCTSRCSGGCGSKVFKINTILNKIYLYINIL